MTREVFGFELFDQSFETYGDVRTSFEWSIPSPFNAATYMVDRWSNGDRSDDVAIYYEDRTADRRGTLTYSELETESDRFANYLDATGVRSGDRVAVNTPRKPETLIAHLGAWKLGVVSVPLSTLFGPDALHYRLDDSDATVCLVDESNLDTLRDVVDSLPALDHVLTLGDVEPRAGERTFSTAVSGRPTSFDVADTAPDDPLVLMYTSGTTGRPKGVVQNHEAVAGHAPGVAATAYNFEINEEELLWSPVEWSWAGTLTLLIAGLFFGRGILAYEDDAKFDPEMAFELIDRYDVTLPRIPPSALRMMQTVDDPDSYDLDGVRLIASGGESPGKELAEWAETTFDAPFHEAYGQTEAWNLMLGDCTAFRPPKEGWIGLQLPGHDVEIVDTETAEPLGPGEIGEIAIKRDDPIVFEEYLGKPEKTAAKFSGEWLLTEDLGERDEDGYFRFVGRKDDVILCSGYKIGPEEVEDAVAAHDAVVDAGVIGVPDETRGEVPKAFLSLADEYTPSDELKSELQSFVRERLAVYEYPRYIEFIDELPTTSTGKIRRASLREREGLE